MEISSEYPNLHHYSYLYSDSVAIKEPSIEEDQALKPSSSQSSHHGEVIHVPVQIIDDDQPILLHASSSSNNQQKASKAVCFYRNLKHYRTLSNTIIVFLFHRQPSNN